VELEPPRVENGKLLLIAGLRERYASNTEPGIPAQWERMMSYKIPNQVGHTAYGVVFMTDDAPSWEYLAGPFDSLCQCANVLRQDDKQDAYPTFKLEACDFCTLNYDFILFNPAAR
jgi:predicted transcriptional regulator YdeE